MVLFFSNFLIILISCFLFLGFRFGGEKKEWRIIISNLVVVFDILKKIKY